MASSSLTYDANFNNITNFSSWVFRNPTVDDDQTVYVNAADPLERQTRAGVFKSVSKLATGLRYENGGASLSGETVCVHAFNSLFYPVLFHGIIAAGGCYTGANPAYTANELEHHFRGTNTKLVITELGQSEVAFKAAAACGIARSHIFVTHSNLQTIPAHSRSIQDLLKHEPLDISRFNDGRKLHNTQETPAILMGTSGTSGLPKFAARSHRALIEECKALTSHDFVKPYLEIRLITVPMFHAFAMPLAMICALRNGIPTYLLPRFQATQFLEVVRRFNITETTVAPQILLKLLTHAKDGDGTPLATETNLQSLRTIWCGGAPLSAEAKNRVEHELLDPDCRVVQSYGATEFGWVATFAYPERDDTGAVGRLLPGCDAKLIPSPSLNQLADDEPFAGAPETRGEIFVRSPWIMTGYVQDPRANISAFDIDGWYRTGDIGQLNDRDRLYILDRAKDLIKVRGWEVSPGELEATLLRHPDIEDAAVVGVVIDDLSLEEAPRAFVVMKPGLSMEVSEVMQWMSQWLAGYKYKQCQIVFVAAGDIPKSANGKILRRVLAEEGTGAAEF